MTAILTRERPVSTQPKSKGGRPYGPQSPSVARVEAFVEFIIALQDDARLCRLGAKALKVLADAHESNRKRFDANAISRDEFDRDERALDRSETKLGFVLLRRSSHLEQRTIPECQSLYRLAEAAA